MAFYHQAVKADIHFLRDLHALSEKKLQKHLRKIHICNLFTPTDRVLYLKVHISN